MLPYIISMRIVLLFSTLQHSYVVRQQAIRSITFWDSNQFHIGWKFFLRQKPNLSNCVFETIL